MLKRLWSRLLILAILFTSAAAITGCESTDAQPQPLTGDQPTHERHDTGIDSQVSDR